MCTYSMIADHFTDKWQRSPVYAPFFHPPVNGTDHVSRLEFEALRKEVADVKELLIKAKDYDARNGEPDCEMADKVELLRKIAKLVGVDLGHALPT